MPNLLDRLTNVLIELQQQENEAKWTKQQADQDLRSSLEYFNKVMENPEEYNILFVGPHFANITFNIGRPHITVEELGSYDYWETQELSLEEKKFLS
ncbi:hypothetical protein JNUCC31_05430 [Paenibacillus sp. JNUCC31]|uniref:hypothetical protein n=1 Tax=Paenibacillus sp. JNUCC-31 TaxID=2777983 RepID=UPI00177FC86E|nr:hypothetical protein [Paenibacillus sp. JNUCC-31]QOS80366.1 hypothetical protein JNUCC31_05430 [Paenibacillus sp. JNUCC-31]